MKNQNVKSNLEEDSFRDALESFEDKKESSIEKIEKIEEIELSVVKSRNPHINRIHGSTGLEGECKLLNNNKVIQIYQNNERNFNSVIGDGNFLPNAFKFSSTISKTPIELHQKYFENPFTSGNLNQNFIKNEIEFPKPVKKRFTRKNNFRVMPIKLNKKEEVYLNYLLFMQEIGPLGSEITILRFNC